MDTRSISQRRTGCTVGREAFSVPRRLKQGWKHRRIHYAQRFTSDSDGRSLITKALDVLLCCDGEPIIESVTNLNKVLLWCGFKRAKTVCDVR